MPEKDPQPSTSAELQVTPVDQPIGTQLKVIPKALYAHVPVSVHTQVGLNKFVYFRQLLLDPHVPLKPIRQFLGKNPETGAPEWQETNTVQDTPNFDIWVKA